MFKRIQLLCCAFVLCMAGAHVAHAAIVISDIEFGDYRLDEPTIATSLTFKLSGTITDAILPGAVNTHILFIGQPAIEQPGTGQLVKSNWYNGEEIQWGYLPATWTPSEEVPNGGTLSLSNPAVNQSSTYGDYILLLNNDAVVQGDTVYGTFRAEGGSFNPSLTNLSEWIVSVGHLSTSTTYPESQTATGSAVPEPGSIALLLLGGRTIGLQRRRH